MATRTILGVGLAAARGLRLSIYAVPHGSGRLLGCQDDRCARDRPGRLTKNAQRQDRPRCDAGVRPSTRVAGSSVGGGKVIFIAGHEVSRRVPEDWETPLVERVHLSARSWLGTRSLCPVSSANIM